MGPKKRYTSVMEKIIKNAVSETSKVLETVIAELKAEVLRVKNENENLKIRCTQFEEVVKKRSVYRETGTSPDPWIIEKCDKAVQCEFFFRHSDDENPNLSDNETQSESSFGPMCEKESSNDSFSFLKTKDMESNSCSPINLSIQTTPQKTADMLIERSSLDSQCDHMENDDMYEMPSHSSEQQNVPFESLHNEQHKDSDKCCETFEMESQDDVCIEYAKTDQSLLDCQEAGQKELNEEERLILHEETEDVTCENSKANLLPAESASSSNVQAIVEDATGMDIEIDQQNALSSEMNTGDSLTADRIDSKVATDFEQGNASPDPSCHLDQAVTLPEDIKTTDGSVESEQACTKIDDTAVQSVSCQDINAKEARNTSQPRSPPKSQYFLRRQRCSSVTLEDAMLLLDAVSQQKYKISPPKKSQTKDSSKTLAPPKLVDIPEATPLPYNASNSEEITCTTESSQLNVTHSRVTVKPAEALELDVCPANVDIQHQESTHPVEAVFDHSVSTSTPIKNTKPIQVTEADSATLNIEDQQDHQNILSPFSESSSTLVTENTTPNVTPTKLDETMQGVDTNTSNINMEEYDKIVTSPATPSLVEHPADASVPSVALAKESLNTSKQEMEGIASSDDYAFDSQQHTYFSATPPTESSNVQPKKGNDSVYLSPTEEGEMKQVTPDHPTRKEVMLIDVTFPIDSTPPTTLAQTLSEPMLQTTSETTEMLDQISGHSDHDGGEFQGNQIVTASSTPETSPLLNPPTQHTVLLKMPGDTGDESSSLVKTITSSSTLSPAELSAVVSAVRSTQTITSPTSPSAGTPSGKKAFVAVPFSLQSVMRPHHKIIVIPRQCKVPPSQAIAKEKAIVLKQKAFATEATTTFISTTDVNLETNSDEGNTVNSLDQQQTTLVTSTTQSLPDTNALITEPSSSDPAKSPCKNTVQIKLNRISFPVSSEHSVSVTDMPVDPPPKRKRGRPPKKNVAVDSSQSKVQPKEDNVFSPITEPSPRVSSKDVSPFQSSPGQHETSVEENQPPAPEQLSPHIVAVDHSYPQHRMTKSQFLAKLDVSPVIQIPKKVDSIEKDAQKASLVDRLRSHLKPHIRTIKKIQTNEMGQDGLNVSVETKSPILTTTPDISMSNQDQVSANLPSQNENKNVTPKTSPAPKNASNKAQVKRRRSPKRNLTPTKTVKKRKIKKKAAANVSIPSTPKLSPMQSKIINSNALLSCVRKGIKKKSFLCKFCRKEFSQKKEIELHIQVHVGKKPFQCNICHRRFSRTMELSRHLKRHNADKKYQCTSCGKAFIEYNNLKRHTYIHTGEKPYSCPHCPRAFTQSGHMRTHIRTKHKDMKD